MPFFAMFFKKIGFAMISVLREKERREENSKQDRNDPKRGFRVFNFQGNRRLKTFIFLKVIVSLGNSH